MLEKAGLRILRTFLSKLAHNKAVFAFFALYLILGIMIHGNFGATWDEPLNRDLGHKTLNYIKSYFSDHSMPWSEASRGLIAEQGPFFEVILASLEKPLNLIDTREIMLMRHLVIFLAFWLGCLAFYFLLSLRFHNRWICLLGVSMFVLAPRLFSHSFYNSKDAVFTSLMIISTLTMVRFIKHRTLLNAVLHSLACALAIDVRVVAGLIPALTVLLLAVLFIKKEIEKEEQKRVWISTGVYVCFLAVFIVIFWPALWENPFRMFFDTLSRISSAKQFDNNYSLYMGSFVRVDQLPWHYLPVWILITMPLSYVLFFIIGTVQTVKELVRNPVFSAGNILNVVFMFMFFVPLVVVIILRPIVYDDWRHMYFLQPYFVAIAVTGISGLLARKNLKKTIKAVVILMLLHGVIILVRYHPYQNVYFNPLAGGDIEKTFELDYWGLSFKEGLEFVLRTEPQNQIRVAVSDFPGRVNHMFLDPSQRQRIQIVPVEQATYFLSNHRQPNNYAAFRSKTYPCVNEVYAVRVAGETLLGVFKIR